MTPVSTQPESLEEVRAQMAARGVTVTAWADQRGFSRATVYAVLSGRVKGRRGEAYEIAKALGIVVPPPDEKCRWLATNSDQELSKTERIRG